MMSRRSEDPVVRSSRREAVLVFCIWLVACVYTVGYCYTFGYERDPASIRYLLGFPDWVFWGIVAPWTVCTLLSYVLAYHVIADDDLGEEQAEADLGSIEDTLGGEGDHA
jgi:hypothetical protein